MSKNTSDHLHRLVKLLKKPEKRYVRRFGMIHSGKGANNYLRLLGLVGGQKDHNDHALRKKGGFTGGNQFPNLKIYLFNLVLKSLDSFYSESTMEERIRRLIRHTAILYEKGMYDACGRILHKAKRSARQHENFLLLFEVLHWEKSLLQAEGMTRKTAQALDGLIREEELLLEKFTNERHYRAIGHRLFRHFSIHNVARTKGEMKTYRQFLKHPLMLREKWAFSYHAKFEFHSVSGLCHYAMGSLPESLASYGRLVQLIESHPLQVEEHPTNYLAALSNYYNILLLLKKYDTCREIIQKIRAIPARSNRTQVFIFRASYDRELGLYLHTGRYQEGLSIVRPLEKGMQQYRDNIPDAEMASFRFGIMHLYFGTGDYSNALHWLNALLNDPASQSSRPDLYGFAKIVQLVMLFELGETDMLEYFIRSAYRFLYTKNRLYKFEGCVLDFMRKRLNSAPAGGSLIPAFKELRSELKTITADPFERQALEYFDFISWLESKITGKPFAYVVRKKAMKDNQ